MTAIFDDLLDSQFGDDYLAALVDLGLAEAFQ